MGYISKLLNRIKQFIFPTADIERAVGTPTVVSKKMEKNINLWYALYINEPPWETDKVQGLGLSAAICRELARPVLLEFNAEITGSQRADFLSSCFQEASAHFLRDLELGLALGGVAFRPYLFGDRLLVDATGPAAFQPTRFDASGWCIGGVFRDKPVRVGRDYYVRLEYHDLEGTDYTIHNRAFASDEAGTALRSEVALATVPEWADIAPETRLGGMTGPLFSYFRTPSANNIDPNSEAGVSIYSGAVDLIRQADEQWSMLYWEYYSGKRKVYANDTFIPVSEFDKDIFSIGSFGLNGDVPFFQVFSPEFRDQPLYRGLQNIIKQIEFQTGLSYGTISDPQTVDKTATEVRASRQRMYVLVDSIQKSLSKVFDGLLYAMDVYAGLYGLAPSGGYHAKYSWGDSVLDDEETKQARLADMRLDVTSGLIRPELYVAQKYGVTEEDALRMMPGLEETAGTEQDEVE